MALQAIIGGSIPSFLPLSFDPRLLQPPAPPAGQQRQLHQFPPRPFAGLPGLPPGLMMQPMQQQLMMLPGGLQLMAQQQQLQLQQQQLRMYAANGLRPGMFNPAAAAAAAAIAAAGGYNQHMAAAAAAASAAAAAGGGGGSGSGRGRGRGRVGRPPGSGRGRGRGRRASSDGAGGSDDDEGGPVKRRRRDNPGLDAEAQLLLLAFLSAVVQDQETLGQCLIRATRMEAQREQQLQQQQGGGATGGPAAAAAAAGGPPAGPPPAAAGGRMGVLDSYKLVQKLATELRGRPVLSLMWQLPLSFDGARR
jgi:hypothetical protein